ncbi:MAG: carbamoyltransferase HypF [Candidatus Aminicenantes bacterium]|nr:carbamoyltransferase HypF [Candidatus Aminicenantes bacterium]
MKSTKILVKGIVQGVGFRPFVYNLAKDMNFNGYVKNTPKGVEIHIEGQLDPDVFIHRLKEESPPHSRISKLDVQQGKYKGYSDFSILETAEGDSSVFAPPDLFTCKDCLEEMFDPTDRRYRYPFINCTNCGPRFTIIQSLPYDRAKTTMKAFTMCKECSEEYRDPTNRRFHAEPVACPQCGPEICFVEHGTRIQGGIDNAIERIKEGKVLGLKGLGGFHLLCDAFNKEAILRLRQLKKRKRKPFALMARNLDRVEDIAYVSSEERDALLSVTRPIVLLQKKKEIFGISPEIDTYGVMLPYTPLHSLIMDKLPLLVATSANFSESPILKDEDEWLAELSDCVLTHNREIAVRCDDSVLKLVNKKKVFLRRARGFVPDPIEIRIPCSSKILALGGELKNTISILNDNILFTSQYLGDMKDLRNQRYLEEVINHFSRLYSFDPDIIACDLHPQFTTTRMAQEWGKPVIKVQHHIAHIYSVLSENGLSPDETFLGIAFDGVGYGEDSAVWGGEFFLNDGEQLTRAFHLRYVPQPGGDLAAKEPWRMALSYLLDTFGDVPIVGTLKEVDEKIIKGVTNAIKNNINCPLTSSMGRLFDAVSAILGIAPLRIDYEAEAPMRLETVASDGVKDYYQFDINGQNIDMRNVVQELVIDKASVPIKSAKFHNTIVNMIVDITQRCRETNGVEKVVLGGGVFLNSYLLSRTLNRFSNLGIQVFMPKRFSFGDEGISAGQAFYAAHQLLRGEKCV